MKELFIKTKTLPEAYHLALTELYEYGEIVPCPDYNTEQLEASATIIIENPTIEPMISKCFFGGPRELEQYRQEILDGILDFEVDKGNWDYTYHNRMEKQFDFIIEDLRRNPYSRRAVIDVRDWVVDTKKDSPACLQNIQYFIRDGKLHCKTLFRSNDAVKATFMNIFALVMLQQRFANELGIPVGSFTHRANSFHCYKKDFETLEGYVHRIRHSLHKDLCYCYEGEWDELMEMEKSGISAMVEELKTH